MNAFQKYSPAPPSAHKSYIGTPNILRTVLYMLEQKRHLKVVVNHARSITAAYANT